MPDALELALANAASNMPKGEELHIENLESIADPSLDKPILNVGSHVDNIRASVLPKEFVNKYDEFMQEQYRSVTSALTDSQLAQLQLDSDKYWASRSLVERPQPTPEDVAFNHKAYMVNDPEQDGLLLSHIKCVLSEFPLINLKLDSLASIVNNVALTIQNAKQSMPDSTDLKHRSLHEWDDQYLINELVERENDLMPFYYELLKRIGSPELQSLVMSSMQGKNNSMVTLAQLCAALGSIPTQAQYKPVDHTLADAYKQLEDALPPHDKFSRRHREDAAALVNQYKLPPEQRDALSDHDFKAYQSFMNELLHRATLMERIPNREAESTKSKAQDHNGFVHVYGQGYVDPRTVPPMRHDGTTDTVWTGPNYPATIPTMPPTYNPYFKEG